MLAVASEVKARSTAAGARVFDSMQSLAFHLADLLREALRRLSSPVQTYAELSWIEKGHCPRLGPRQPRHGAAEPTMASRQRAVTGGPRVKVGQEVRSKPSLREDHRFAACAGLRFCISDGPLKDQQPATDGAALSISIPGSLFIMQCATATASLHESVSWKLERMHTVRPLATATA
jgi:hypothetical protein